MQFQMTFSTDDAKEFATLGQQIAVLLQGTSNAKVATATVSTTAKAAAKPAKAKKEEPAAEDDDTDLFGDEIEAEETDADETEAEADAAEETEEPEIPKRGRGRPPVNKDLDLDKDIVPAFKAYHAAKGREVAKKLLAKFKVASVRELSPSQYPVILKILKAA